MENRGVRGRRAAERERRASPVGQRAERFWNGLFLSGVLLLVVGSGNWVVGARKVRHYQHEVARLPHPTSRATLSPLPRPPTPQEERYRIARSKMDFYHVVASGGRLMVVAGLVLGAAGALRPSRGGREQRK